METNAQQESEKPRVEIKLENLGTPKGFLILYFSYETIVSFSMSAGGENDKQTIKNLWSTTTGKLLNELCSNKSERIEETPFKEALKKAFNLVF